MSKARKSKKQIAWDKLSDEINALYKGAAAFTKDLEGKPLSPLNGSVTSTEKPVEARNAWRAVIAKVEAQAEDFQKDEWVAEVVATSLYNVACMSSLLREKDEAFKSLDMAIEKGFKNVALLEKDVDFEWLRGDPKFAELVDDLKVKLGPLTIESVIRSEIKRGKLTKDGIDPLVNAEVRSCVVYHHEWIRSPELKGLSCLMLASLPNGKAGVKLVHDLEGKTLIGAGKLDGSKIEFLEL